MNLIKGFAGKPTHPPLTDIPIGAYTVGTAMLVLAAFGFEEAAMVRGARWVIAFGVLVAIVAAVTGLIDWLAIRNGTPARTLGTIHLVLMVISSTLFGVTQGWLDDGYEAGVLPAGPLVLALIAEALLLAGGYLGGALVFVYGTRVLGRPDVPVREALAPGKGG